MMLKAQRFTRFVLALAFILLSTMILSHSGTCAASDSFKLLNYSVNPLQGNNVYPGSSNVEVVVDTQYIGSLQARGVVGCLILPRGFTPSRGYTSCSPAYTPNGTVYGRVEPGSLVKFKFYININRSVKPGTYELPLNISYYAGNELYTTLIKLIVRVEEYPKPLITILNAYLAPNGYPGSRARLVITLYNNGSVDIAGGTVKVILPPGFTPAESYVELQPLPRHSTASISVQVSISPDVKPGIYVADLHGDVTAVTPDGVNYLAVFEGEAAFAVNPPPEELIKIVDAGVTAAPPAESALTKAYVTILVASPDTTVYAVEAHWSIVKGAYFANGSTTSLTFVSGAYSYGSHITITSDPLVCIETRVAMHVDLNILVYNGGSTFWIKVSRDITIKLEKHTPKLKIVNVYWTEGVAYPGSKGLTLNVAVENDDILDIRDFTAVIELPDEAFIPSKLVTHLKSLPAFSQSILSFTGISVKPSAQPGVYIASLKVFATAVLRDGSYTNLTWEVKLPVPILAPIKAPLKIIDYSTPVGEPFRGMCLSQLNLVLEVAEPADVVSAYVNVTSLSGASFTETPSVVVRGLRYGQITVVSFRGLCINANESNVKLAVIVTGKAVVNNAEYNFTEIKIVNLPTRRPRLNISLVGSDFTPLPASGLYTANGYVELKLFSQNPYTITTLLVSACLENAVYMNGEKCRVFSYSQRLSYGAVTTLKIGPILVNLTDTLKANLKIIGVVDTGAGIYVAAEERSIYINLSRPAVGLKLCYTSIRAGGRPSPLLPGQENVVITLTFVNPTPYSVSTVEPAIAGLPKGFILKDIGGSCIHGVPPGSSCTLTLVVDTDNSLRPGFYKLNITLLQYLTVDNSVMLLNTTASVPLLVDNPEKYIPKLELLSAYWGQTPQVVYEHSGIQPLTLIIFNPGRYTVEGVRVSIEVFNKTVELLDNTVPCASSLPVGSVCRAVFHVDLEGAPNGRVAFNVTIRYIFNEFNTNIHVAERRIIVLEVERFTSRPKLILLSYGWINGWHAYPLTRNATFTVTLANQNPYSISGVLAKLILPQGFTTRYGNVVIGYVEGPIAPFKEFTLKFNINIGNVSPGKYKGALIVSYVPNVAGVTTERTQTFNVVLEVNSPQNEIEVINTRWVGLIPNNDTKGAILEVNLRNIGFNVMKAIVAHVKLPPGVTCALNNESTAMLPAYLQGQVSLEKTLRLGSPHYSYIELARVLEQLLESSGTATLKSSVLTHGSLFKLLIPLNLRLQAPLRFDVNITLSFIDQWGEVREVSFTVKVPPYGSAKIISVSCQREVGFVNGVGIIRLNVTNIGSAPIYNVYVYVVPQSPIVTINESTFYFSVLRPGETKTIDLAAYYNPASLRYFGGSEGEYSSVPLLVTVIYRDLSGSMAVFNTSTSFMMKPFILLSLGRDVKVEYRGGTLYAGGTVENHGISKAYSVLVVLKYGNLTSSTFIGDIDPGSQSAFRVELKTPIALKGGNATVIVFYRDAYGGLHSISRTYAINIVEKENATTTVTGGERRFTREYAVTIVAVALFLAFTAFIIKRFLKKHEAKLGV